MKTLFRLLKYAKPYRKEFILTILFVAIETSFELLMPKVMADIIDNGVLVGDVNYILEEGIVMVIAATISLVCGLLFAKFAAKAIHGFGSELRKAEFRKIQEYSFKNLDHFDTSSLITRMTSDVMVVQNAFSSLRPIVRAPIMLAMGIFFSFMMSPELALVFVIACPILGVALIFIVNKVAPMYTVLQEKIDRLNLVVEENLNAIKIVKAYTKEKYEEDKFAEVNDDLNKKATLTYAIGALNMPIFQATMYIVIILILFLGANLIFEGKMAVGSLTGLLSYVLQIMNSLMMISNIFMMLTRSIASAKRVAEVFDEEVGLVGGDIKEVLNGDITFDHVSFKYDINAEENVLSDINFKVKSGSTIGILGGTGSAKSSLVSLIPRLYDVTEGKVLVGGVDVREYDLKGLREAVGIVLQKNVLFSGTILENLLWGDERASKEEIDKALKIAGAYDVVYSFKDGLDTCLDEGGVNVSGGQKQRLCIARALLKKPKILILDDSTSAVDTATEKTIREGLASLKDMTKIIISQRIISVKDADMIIILDDGKIINYGDHDTLLESSDVYKELYTSQMKGGDD